jgi:hypothetical protein
MSPVTVFQTYSPAEAQLVRSRLDAAGIQAIVTHELSALSMEGYSMATGGILVQVPDEQAQAAREILNLPPAGSSDEPAS